MQNVWPSSKECQKKADVSKSEMTYQFIFYVNYAESALCEDFLFFLNFFFFLNFVFQKSDSTKLAECLDTVIKLPLNKQA